MSPYHVWSSVLQHEARLPLTQVFFDVSKAWPFLDMVLTFLVQVVFWNLGCGLFQMLVPSRALLVYGQGHINI